MTAVHAIYDAMIGMRIIDKLVRTPDRHLAIEFNEMSLEGRIVFRFYVSASCRLGIYSL